MKRIGSFLLAVILTVALAGCGGGSIATQHPTKPGEPLDPQGNWLFTLTSTHLNGDKLAGQLYELNPPVVNSDGGLTEQPQVLCQGKFVINGQASGTNSISLNAQQSAPFGQSTAFTFTGTIADDQAHMSGTWAVNTGEPLTPCIPDASGTWTAQLLAPVTGNWSGSVASGSTTLQVSAALTELTDQTAPNMGMVTGTVTLTGAPCFATATTFTIPAYNNTAALGQHIGERLVLTSNTNADGVSLTSFATVSPDGTSALFDINASGGGLTIKGGTCDGIDFGGTLAHN